MNLMKQYHSLYMVTMLAIIVWGNCMSDSLKEHKLFELEDEHPFAYDLGIKVLPSSHPDAQVTICAHGYGHNNKIADVMRSFQVFSDHIIGFNFPESD